jgi:hypothetical protein
MGYIYPTLPCKSTCVDRLSAGSDPDKVEDFEGVATFLAMGVETRGGGAR